MELSVCLDFLPSAYMLPNEQNGFRQWAASISTAHRGNHPRTLVYAADISYKSQTMWCSAVSKLLLV
ncbi:hypothetical protein HPB49_009067 [Dermacentor silvarum]|uniref:Uncharacterized protein n=1 Tax=Dermacentor silvarum TaxID=543639 RepID=A0ACB8DY91_DERSI|nr:hypothetical protein HPB49_009067 [Dermacentor silvarum]